MRNDKVIYLVHEKKAYNPELGRQEATYEETAKLAGVYEKATNLEGVASGKGLIKVESVRFRGAYLQPVSFIRIDGTEYDILAKKIYMGHTLYHLKERLV